MDELIRELEKRMQANRELATDYADPLLVTIHDARADAFETVIEMANEAQRRMADREPAWDLQ